MLYLLIVRFFDSIMCLNPCEDLSAKTLKCQTKKTAILISCFDWYVNRLKYIDKYLQDRGYSTLVLISDFNHSIKKNDTHLNYVKNLRYIADGDIIFPVSRFTEVVYEICKCK